MSSREIAELTGKNHGNVIRDVRYLLDELGLEELSFESYYIAANGKRNPEYLLPHRETMILLTGYSVPMRAKVVDRWTELEKKRAAPAVEAFKVPTSLKEALMLALAHEQRIEALEVEKAHA